MSQKWFVYPMSAMESLLCFNESKKMMRHLCIMGCGVDESKSIGENAAICSHCIFDIKGKRVFKNAHQVLETLSLDQIANYAKQYNNLLPNNFEYGFNSSFKPKRS